MTADSFQLAADLVVIVHAAFVAFVIAGGLLVLRWRSLAWLHVPAAVWGVAVGFGGWFCPLTDMENYLRARSGAAVYQDDFIERYLLPLLYPAHLTRGLQLAIGCVALAVNVLVYGYVVRRLRDGWNRSDTSARSASR